MLELVVVAFLITLSLSLVVGVNFKQRDSLQVRSSARELYSFLLSVRSQAILQDRDNRCWYLPEQNKVVSEFRQRALVFPDTVSLLFPSENLQSAGLGKILIANFYPDGSASGGDLCLQAGPRAMTVRVDPILGFVSLISGCTTLSSEPSL